MAPAAILTSASGVVVVISFLDEPRRCPSRHCHGVTGRRTLKRQTRPARESPKRAAPAIVGCFRCYWGIWNSWLKKPSSKASHSARSNTSTAPSGCRLFRT